jgi:uncharacterized SAM-binding protein YcdF (DUF218 family)
VWLALAVLLVFALAVLSAGTVARAVGAFLVVSEPLSRADAIVVLNSGVELYARLTEAAALYREGWAPRIVINGNRKSEIFKNLERKGLQPCCPWYEDSLRILALLGVPREAVLPVSLEDAYDTISEARGLRQVVLDRGLNSVIVTTSKFHTRRSRLIWKQVVPPEVRVSVAGARDDPYSPDRWWRDGRQIRWLLAEYGAFCYLWWKSWGGIEGGDKPVEPAGAAGNSTRTREAEGLFPRAGFSPEPTRKSGN